VQNGKPLVRTLVKTTKFIFYTGLFAALYAASWVWALQYSGEL
jgi:hypothetical protein